MRVKHKRLLATDTQISASLCKLQLCMFVENAWRNNFLSIPVHYIDSIKAKGAPGSECRTYTWLVSPAFGREKKNLNPLNLDKIRHLELTYTLYKYRKNYNSLIDN